MRAGGDSLRGGGQLLNKKADTRVFSWWPSLAECTPTQPAHTIGAHSLEVFIG